MKLWQGRELRYAALVGGLLLAACGGDEQEAARRATPALRGAALVAGSSLESWGLLAIPREGGTAELRAVDDPSLVLWTGTTPLPPLREAHPLETGSVVLRTAQGAVHRYDPAFDQLTELDRVGEGAVWVGAGDAGAWTDPSEGSVLVVSSTDAWRVPVPGTPVWAAPLGEGRALALVGTPEAARPAILERDAPAPAVEGADAEDGSGLADAAGEPDARAARDTLRLAMPAILTAWGRRLAAAAPDGRSLRVVSVPELELVSETELDGPITALAASPSSHSLYAAVGVERPRVVAVGRLDARAERLGRVETSVREIRPSLFGGSLLLGGAGAATLLGLEGADPVPLPGGWRADLPLGLPGDRALVEGEGGAVLWSPTEEEVAPTPTGAPADAWWLAVRWRPPRPERVAERAEEPEAEGQETVAAAESESEAEAERGDAAPTSVGEAGRPVGSEPETTPPGDETPADPSVGAVAAGFYAIVGSAQQANEILALTRRLGDAGWQADVQRHRDEASEIWYRALVGPYESREEAEAAARQLRRERGLQAWIAEVGPDTRPEDPSS